MQSRLNRKANAASHPTVLVDEQRFTTHPKRVSAEAQHDRIAFESDWERSISIAPRSLRRDVKLEGGIRPFFNGRGESACF